MAAQPGKAHGLAGLGGRGPPEGEVRVSATRLRGRPLEAEAAAAPVPLGQHFCVSESRHRQCQHRSSDAQSCMLHGKARCNWNRPTFKALAAWRLDILKGEQGPARQAPAMPSWLSCAGKVPCATGSRAKRACCAAGVAAARGLPAAGPGSGASWRAAGLLPGGRALRPGRLAWVARAAAARRGAAAMKCCTRRRCSSESPLELQKDSSVSAEDVRLPCSATSH